jgi:hypothetical protein
MGFCITGISMLQLVCVKASSFMNIKYPSTVLEMLPPSTSGYLRYSNFITLLFEGEQQINYFGI